MGVDADTERGGYMSREIITLEATEKERKDIEQTAVDKVERDKPFKRHPWQAEEPLLVLSS